MNLGANFLTDLQRAFSRPLPGADSRRTYAPELSYGRHDGPPHWDSRWAAVLILIYAAEESWRVPLTLRPATLATHSGQISLPGGEIEEDESVEQAALRELDEELGAVPDDAQFLGRLSPIFVYASNYMVTPCVAACSRRPPFVPNPAEVANLIEPRLVDLLDQNRYQMRPMERRGVVYKAPEIAVAGESIWGATRLILAEFCEIVRRIDP